MKKLIFILLISLPGSLRAQVFDTSTVNNQPTYYLDTLLGYARCRLVVKDCANCPQYVIKAWRVEYNASGVAGGLARDFYRVGLNIGVPKQAIFQDRIVFRNGRLLRLFKKKELYFINWYDVNW